MSQTIALAILAAVCVGCFWLTLPRRSRRLRRYQRRKQEIVLPEQTVLEQLRAVLKQTEREL